MTLNLGYSQEDAIIPLPQLGVFDEDVDKYYYYKDVDGDLNKFLGTWKYQDASKELIVTFYLKTHIESGGTYYDEIYAKFKFTNNGTVIYNTLADTSVSGQLKIFGSSIRPENRNKMSLAYNEPTNISYKKSLYQKLEIEYLPCNTFGCTPQLKWDIFWTKSKPSDVWPFKIPSHLILTKQ
jgi:hypothetical protein